MIKTTFLRSLLAAITLAASSFFALEAQGAPGDIYETNESNILIFKAIGGTPGTFATGFTNPKGIVFDGVGHLYVADASKNSIIIFTVPGASGSTYASGLSSPVGLAFDITGNLYVAEAGSGNVIKFAPDRTKTTFASGLGGPSGLAFDNSGNLFVADFSGGKVYKITPAGGQSTFASGLSFPAGLAVDTAGNLFAADSGSGTIFKFAPDGTKSTFASGLGRPYGLALDANGNLIVADNEEGATLRFTPAGVKSTVFQSDFNTPQFVAVESATHQLLNISTRGPVQTGDDILIAGFVVGGIGPVGTQVVVRALGPTLTPLGVPNALQDPVLEVHDSSGNLIASNDNWKDAPEANRPPASLVPKDDRESAISISLHGGSFTAIVRGANNSTGTALVEVYNVVQ